MAKKRGEIFARQAACTVAVLVPPTKKATLLGEDGEILNSHLRRGVSLNDTRLAQINTNCKAIRREFRIIASFGNKYRVSLMGYPIFIGGEGENLPLTRYRHKSSKNSLYIVPF